MPLCCDKQYKEIWLYLPGGRLGDGWKIRDTSESKVTLMMGLALEHFISEINHCYEQLDKT